MGRVIFRSVFSCESQRPWLAWVRRVGRGGLKSLLPQPPKQFLPISSFCLGWPGISFLNQHPRGTYLALAKVAVAPCPGLCGLELSEKTHCRFLGFGREFIESTGVEELGEGISECTQPPSNLWNSSGEPLQSWGRLGMRLFAKALLPRVY